MWRYAMRRPRPGMVLLAMPLGQVTYGRTAIGIGGAEIGFGYRDHGGGHHVAGLLGSLAIGDRVVVDMYSFAAIGGSTKRTSGFEAGWPGGQPG